MIDTTFQKCVKVCEKCVKKLQFFKKSHKKKLAPNFHQNFYFRTIFQLKTGFSGNLSTEKSDIFGQFLTVKTDFPGFGDEMFGNFFS